MFRHLVLGLLCASLVSAHLAGGSDAVVDGYLLDFGHDPAELRAGEPAFFNLNVLEDEEYVEADRVWIRISGDETVYTGTHALQEGNLGFTYTFPRGGSYEITMRVDERSETLVEHDFTVDVASQGPAPLVWLLGGVIVVLGAVVGWLWRR